MIILIDMDDTIEQLLKAWLNGVNKKYGCSVKYEECTTWDVSTPYPDLTRDQVYAIPDEPGFWATVEPIPGAAEAIKRFMDAGHEVYIVTATPYSSVPEKMDDLLFRWFPFISWKQVIIASNKQLIRGDVLIDDGVHNLEGGDYIKILMTAPHNKDYDAESNGMIRVHNWKEIEEVISGIAGGTMRGIIRDESLDADRKLGIPEAGGRTNPGSDVWDCLMRSLMTDWRRHGSNT